MIVEIIGLPGAGKSTILKGLFNRREIRKQFFTWEQAMKDATFNFISNNKIPMSESNLNKVKIIFRIPLIGMLFSDYLLQKKVKYSHSLYESPWENISETIIEGIMGRSGLHPSMKPHYINWELEKIMRSRILMDYCKYEQKHIILDEGIITTISTLEYIDENSEYFNKMVLPDAVIFLKADLDVIVKVAEERQKKGRQVQLLNKNSKEIYTFYNSKLNKYIQIKEILEKRKIPVFEFNRNDDIDDLVNELNKLAFNCKK